LSSTRRKIDALRQIIEQIDRDLGALLVDNLNNDSMVIGSLLLLIMSRTFVFNNAMFIFIEILDKYTHLQALAHEKDEQLKRHRQQWKYFKRQLDDLEQAAQQCTKMSQLGSNSRRICC
jgi:hypothetical protein